MWGNGEISDRIYLDKHNFKLNNSFKLDKNNKSYKTFTISVFFKCSLHVHTFSSFNKIFIECIIWALF